MPQARTAKPTEQDKIAIFNAIKPLLQEYAPPLIPDIDSSSDYGLSSPKQVVIAGRTYKKVFFASVEIAKAFVGFYYMPIYADAGLKSVLQPELLAMLKGKSCFHIKTLTPEVLEQIREALKVGFALYQKRGWV
jgi:hypothetical protein